jgi:diadenosine tetraphosphate (Ap4A) HIT family hydrolase
MAATTPPEPCVFCDIIAGRVESSMVYGDDHVVAFMDIRPLTRGHLLVVPRAHADGLDALAEDLGGRIFAVAHQLGRALRQSDLPCAGVNMFLADGVAAGQEVFHVHLHVIPRNPGDGFRLKARPRTPARGELEATAERVRQAVGALPG